MHADPESAKKTDSLIVFFCTFGIRRHKSCAKNISEIDYRRQSYKINLVLKMFALLGLADIKAVQKTLVKLTTGDNPIK
jgi:hypothetical protein